MGSIRHLAKLEPCKTLFLCCDVQEKFRKAIPLFGNMVQNINKLLRAGKAFDVPLIATEQYPKGLGHTDKEISISNALAVIPKTEFTMYQPELLCYMKELIQEKPDDIVLFGVETHICILQSSMDFLQNEYRVHVVADCCASRSNQDRDIGLRLLRQIGCFIQTSESVIFNLLQDKNHPKFGEIQKVVTKVSANMGLAKKKDKKIKAPKKPDKKAAKKKDTKKKDAKKKDTKKASAKKPDAKKAKKPDAKKAKKPDAKKPSAKKPSVKKPDAKKAKKPDAKKAGAKKPDAKKTSPKKDNKKKDVKKSPSKKPDDKKPKKPKK